MRRKLRPVQVWNRQSGASFRKEPRPKRWLVGFDLRLAKGFAKISFTNFLRTLSSFVFSAEHDIARIEQTHFNVSIQLFLITLGQVQDAAQMAGARAVRQAVWNSLPQVTVNFISTLLIPLLAFLFGNREAIFELLGWSL